MKDYSDNDEKTEYWTPNKLIIWGVIIIFGLIVFFSCYYIVNPGERAILLTLGNANQVPIEGGLHLKLPMIQSVVIMNVQQQRYDAGSTSASSRDLQIVTTDLTVNYHILPNDVVTIYTTVGQNYQSVIIEPAVQEILKEATAKYTAEELIENRSQVKDEIQKILTDRLASSNIYVDQISITNFQFSDTFNAAIENKVTAAQNALAAQNKLAQVQYEAQQKIEAAKGDQEAIQLQSQAINQYGGADYLQYLAIQKWSGNVPLIVSGTASIPFINLPSSSFNPSGSGNVLIQSYSNNTNTS